MIDMAQPPSTPGQGSSDRRALQLKQGPLFRPLAATDGRPQAARFASGYGRACIAAAWSETIFSVLASLSNSENRP